MFFTKVRIVYLSLITEIYEIGTDLHSVTTKLKESAALATEWYDSNLLERNLKKYQTMNICSIGANQYHTDVINIKNTEISPSNSLTLLGVTIDDKQVSETISLLYAKRPARE